MFAAHSFEDASNNCDGLEELRLKFNFQTVSATLIKTVTLKQVFIIRSVHATTTHE